MVSLELQSLKKVLMTESTMVKDASHYNYKTRFKPGNQCALGHGFGRPQVWNKEKLDKLAEALYDWMQEPESIYLKTFCVKYGLITNKVDEYLNRSSVFRDAWSQAKEWQEAKLVTEALAKRTSDSMTKFVLVNVHKWKERTEVSGDSANPLALVLEKIAKQNQEPIQCEIVPPEQISTDGISKND